MLVLPTSAEAGWRIDRAKQIAEIVWHDPCGDTPVAVEWTPMSVTAQVRGDAPCRIYFDAGERLDWPSFCSYVIHEYGHLAGFLDIANEGPGWRDFSHSSDPDSIMAEFFDNDRRCRKRGRPYLERHGRL